MAAQCDSFTLKDGVGTNRMVYCTARARASKTVRSCSEMREDSSTSAKFRFFLRSWYWRVNSVRDEMQLKSSAFSWTHANANFTVFVILQAYVTPNKEENSAALIADAPWYNAVQELDLELEGKGIIMRSVIKPAQQPVRFERMSDVRHWVDLQVQCIGEKKYKNKTKARNTCSTQNPTKTNMKIRPSKYHVQK